MYVPNTGNGACELSNANADVLTGPGGQGKTCKNALLRQYFYYIQMEIYLLCVRADTATGSTSKSTRLNMFNLKIKIGGHLFRVF